MRFSKENPKSRPKVELFDKIKNYINFHLTVPLQIKFGIHKLELECDIDMNSLRYHMPGPVARQSRGPTCTYQAYPSTWHNQVNFTLYWGQPVGIRPSVAGCFGSSSTFLPLLSVDD